MTVYIKPVTPEFSIAGQLTPEDMVTVKEAGYKSVIINIPDFEQGRDQPLSGDVIAAAQELGLEIVYQPVPAGQITVNHILDFAQYIKKLPEPVVAYCKSGVRCGILYSAALQMT